MTAGQKRVDALHLMPACGSLSPAFVAVVASIWHRAMCGASSSAGADAQWSTTTGLTTDATQPKSRGRGPLYPAKFCTECFTSLHAGGDDNWAATPDSWTHPSCLGTDTPGKEPAFGKLSPHNALRLPTCRS